MLTFRIVDYAFDRVAVLAPLDRAQRKALMRAGAFVMTTARRSIQPAIKRRMNRRRQRKLGQAGASSISQPGSPPRSHVRNRNIKQIYFAYEAARHAVICGPILFKLANGVNVPQVLEHGGRSNVRRRGFGGKLLGRQSTRVRRRPFMRPALEQEMPKFPDLFKHSVR